MTYKPLFPYFGGKSRVAAQVWERFGKVTNYVEPFFGSGAVYFHCPYELKTATVNDLDGYICNFWRAVQADPEAVAEHADWPVNELDLHARNAYVTSRREEFTDWLRADPERYDVKIAGWWVWGACAAIGNSWATGRGSWGVQEDGTWGKVEGGAVQGLPQIDSRGRGIHRPQTNIRELMTEINSKLRGVRVCCGDFSRTLGKGVTYRLGNNRVETAVFLDPPYADDRRAGLYAKDDLTVYQRAEQWCRENGDNPLLRIALCGYEGHYNLPRWEAIPWKANGGYGSQGKGRGRANASREVVLFSPSCANGGSQTEGKKKC